MRLLIGVTQLTEPGPEAQVRLIKRLLIHNEYDPADQSNDIALLEMSEPVQCNSHIQLVCVPKATVNVAQLDTCYVAGWGATTARSQTSSDILQEAKVHLINVQICNSSEWYQGEVHSHNLCAGYPEGGIDTCQGDSGGPLMCKDKDADFFWVVGITSWGRGCARAKRPGIYTSVRHFYDWIALQMEMLPQSWNPYPTASPWTRPTNAPWPTQKPWTRPPTTQMPWTRPPTTQMPWTRPPTTQMPWTRPPTTQMPWTRPPTTQMPWTRPPTTQMPWTRPPTTQMPWTRPPTTQMPWTRPPTTYNPWPTTLPTPKPWPTAPPAPNPWPTTLPTSKPWPTAPPAPNPWPTTLPTPKPWPTAPPAPNPWPTAPPPPKPRPTTMPTPKPSSLPTPVEENNNCPYPLKKLMEFFTEMQKLLKNLQGIPV
ncbi:uncharacterized protein RBU47_003010 [Passerculus sandwichensis]